MTSSENCVFCGSPEARAIIVFPATFTAYQLLQAGDKACIRCAEMFQDAKFRRNCWILKDGVVTVLEDPLRALDALPEPPFLLYFTKQKRKHGWILAVQNPVLCKDKFILVVDEEKILFNRSTFDNYHDISRRLLDSDIPKFILLGGYPPPSMIHKYALTHPICVLLLHVQREPLWRFCVEFARKK